MRKFLQFLLIGSFFATVEEFLTVVVVRKDIGSYLFTLLILFPVFLTFVWLTSPLIGKLVAQEPLKEIAIFFAYGLVGLFIEWFLIGLSPWSDPSADPIVMLIFQLGMFSFWATVAFAPRIFVDTNTTSRSTRGAILKFYIPYFILVYVIGWLVPERLKFITIIGLIVIGYLTLNLFYIKYFLRLSKRTIKLRAQRRSKAVCIPFDLVCGLVPGQIEKSDLQCRSIQAGYHDYCYGEKDLE